MSPACRCVSRLPDPKCVAGGRNEPSVPVCFQAAGPEMRGGRAGGREGGRAGGRNGPSVPVCFNAPQMTPWEIQNMDFGTLWPYG